MKVQLFFKTLTPSNCGLKDMNDVYITISNLASPEELIGEPPKDIKCIDRNTKKNVLLRFKHEKNGEYRLSKLGPYIREKLAKPGDEIFIERREFEEHGNEIFFIGISKSAYSENNPAQYPKWHKYCFNIIDK